MYIDENEFESVVCKMAAILSRHQGFNQYLECNVMGLLPDT